MMKYPGLMMMSLVVLYLLDGVEIQQQTWLDKSVQYL